MHVWIALFCWLEQIKWWWWWYCNVADYFGFGRVDYDALSQRSWMVDTLVFYAFVNLHYIYSRVIHWLLFPHQFSSFKFQRRDSAEMLSLIHWRYSIATKIFSTKNQRSWVCACVVNVYLRQKPFSSIMLLLFIIIILLLYEICIAHKFKQSSSQQEEQIEMFRTRQKNLVDFIEDSCSEWNVNLKPLHCCDNLR